MAGYGFIMRSYKPPPNKNTAIPIAATARINVEGFAVEILRYSLLSENGTEEISCFAMRLSVSVFNRFLTAYFALQRVYPSLLWMDTSDLSTWSTGVFLLF